ncbi:MAG TPA: tyrosine-type recombinase/integrase [Herpetosiphonaceae bacterium]
MLDPTFQTWRDLFITDLTDSRRSPTTITAHAATITAFLHWLAEQPDPPSVHALPAAVFEQYVEYLRDSRVSLHTTRRIAAGKQVELQPLKTTTILAYIGVLTRWLQWLKDEGELTALTDRRNRPLTPAQLAKRLERLVDRPQPRAAPRMPDLRRLPAYYDLQLAAFVEADAHQRGDDTARARVYLNLLRNRALIAVLFASGGRISEVLSLTTTVQRAGRIVDMAPISGKGRKRRSLRLDETARAWIAEYLEARAARYPVAEALFISHGPKANGKRLSAVSAWRVVKEAAHWLADERAAEGAAEKEVAAIRAVSPHGLRHFLAQALLDADAEYKDIAELLGHSSTVVTEQVYARPDEQRTHELVDTLAPRPLLGARKRKA